MVYSTDLRRKNNPEITDIIYDTLMQNDYHSREFDLQKVKDCFVDRSKGKIEFTYGKHKYVLTVQ